MSELLELYRRSETNARLAELHDLVHPTIAELTRDGGYERAFVALVDTERGALQGAVGVNVPDELLDTLRAVEGEAPGPLVQSLLLGKPLRVDDAMRDPRVSESERAYYAAFGMLAFAAIPLQPASGVLVVSKDEPVTEREINELLPYAGQLVAALAGRVEAARLRESGEQHAIEKEWLWWMVNAQQDPIVLSDEHNNIILQNGHAERLLKSGPDDSPGKRRAIEVNNFLLSATLSSIALGPGAIAGPLLTLVDPIEGDDLHFEVICQPATNLRTGQRGLASVLKNVTDLRRAAEELTRSLEELQRTGEEARVERDRLNLILKSVANPIVVTDAAGQIVLMNEPAERLLRAPEGVGRATTTYLANDAKLSSFLSQLRLEAARARRGEIQLVDPRTEESLTMSVTATEVRDELGQVTAIVSVLNDLTKIRELERRTVEQQLFESEKLAAVGRMAAAVAHEINNPLEAIKNALYLVVTNTRADDPNRRFLEIASKETERVSGIIRQMLGFYRPRPVKQATDVNQILQDVLSLMERPLRQAKVALRCDIDPALPTLLAAPDGLKQVFLNMVLNARDAMPGGGELRVSTRYSSGEASRAAGGPLGPVDDETEFLSGRYALVRFQDTGQGISEEHQRHIFEPFFTTKQEQHGTGLGLWVSLGIVQQHGGQIKIRSRPGRGATFTIALPVGGDHD